MKIGNFEIRCTSCGCRNVRIIDVYREVDEDEVERIVKLKCADCKESVEL